ncbi:MAG: hypothetical protein ACRD3Q_15895, partial [Terriglobales bacterium]
MTVATLCTIPFAQAKNTGNAAPQFDFSSVILSMEQAQRASKPQIAYQLIRQYQLLGSNRSEVNSTVVAAVDYLPPDHQTYVIEAHSGSSRGEQV